VGEVDVHGLRVGGHAGPGNGLVLGRVPEGGLSWVGNGDGRGEGRKGQEDGEGLHLD